MVGRGFEFWSISGARGEQTFAASCDGFGCHLRGRGTYAASAITVLPRGYVPIWGLEGRRVIYLVLRQRYCAGLSDAARDCLRRLPDGGHWWRVRWHLMFGWQLMATTDREFVLVSGR